MDFEGVQRDVFAEHGFDFLLRHGKMRSEGGHDIDVGVRRQEFIKDIGEDARVGVEAREIRRKDEDLLQRAVDFVKSGFDEGDFVFQSQREVCSTFTSIGCHSISWVEVNQ